MKRVAAHVAVLLCICLLTVLAGCQSGQTDPVNTTTTQSTATTSAATAQSTTKKVPLAQTTTAATTTTAPAFDELPPQILSVEKFVTTRAEWDNDADVLPVYSFYESVTLEYESAQAYPELAQTLSQTASMLQRSMDEEYDNLLSWAQEELSDGTDGFETGRSILNTQVRRADYTVFSVLSDSWSDYGWIEDYRGMHGTNYDVGTGRELALNDVVNVNNDLADAVADELNRHQWAGDFDYRDAVEAYFANTPYEDISWTLDYNGVTFYFADGELTEEELGRQTATVTFAQHPELFEEQYMVVPEAYIVELPLDSSFFTDLDGDGDVEELNITGYYDPDMGFYTQYGIYTDLNGAYHYEECFADGFVAYYVKTADGSHYVYLFCEENEGYMPGFSLMVIDVTGGMVANIGSMVAGPGYIPEGIYRVPTDPYSFWLDDFESMAQDMMVYCVGTDGMPELLQEMPEQNGASGDAQDGQNPWLVFEPETMESIVVDREFYNDTPWFGYATVDPASGETRMLPYEDADGTQVEIAMELQSGGSGWFAKSGVYSDISWDFLDDSQIVITMEGGQNYYMSAYTMGGSSYLWLLLELEETLVWLY